MGGDDEAAAAPFFVHISTNELHALKQKLAHAVLAPDINGDEWQAGVPPDVMKRLLTYWRDEYDWRATEKELDTYPQFHTKILVSDGFEPLDIRFLHQKSRCQTQFPCCLSTVVPSLPNFGFSSGVCKKGFGIKHYAEVCHKLMMGLGYTKYGAYILRRLDVWFFHYLT